MDTRQRENPFQVLYLTEAMTDPNLYWELFSPRIITGEAQKLFALGNVVLLGSNGTGKSMLLRLFAPSVQAAYLRHGREMPLPKASQRLLGIGINFVVAGVDRLAARRLTPDRQENILQWSIMFGDYLNYFLVREILTTLQFLGTSDGKPLAELLRARVDREVLEQFAEWLAGRDCWFGALNGKKRFEEVQQALSQRLHEYRAYSNWNSDELPEAIKVSKSEIAQPILECRRGLAELGILDQEIPLTVTIDQYETLLNRDYDTVTDPEGAMGRALCRVVNAFMAMRAPEVSYKIAVRPYSWDREMRVFGSDAHLEFERDYQKVDLDDVLSRKEATSSWIFPVFARDVASRRMALTLGGKAKDHGTWLKGTLARLSPEEELLRYCAKDENVLLPKNEAWSNEWRTALAELYRGSKFKAKLAETWINQHAGRKGTLPKVPSDFERGEWARPYWHKERREALLMQIASSCRQRRVYGGASTLLTLSGYNITIFLNLCREIWDTNERAIAKGSTTADNPISVDIQTDAIRKVAEGWFNKLTEFPEGGRRQDFIGRLGLGIRKALLADKGLVYPGHNGFSLLIAEYDRSEAVPIKTFLENARDFGALISSRHTSKEHDGRLRKKWYIFPLLCVNFEIPVVRTKEPYYADLTEVAAWLSDKRPAIVFRGPGAPRRRKGKRAGRREGGESQSSLFSEKGSRET